MSQTISARLEELGFALPAPAPAVGNYVPRLRIGSMLYISGQLPVQNGTAQYVGQVFAMENRRMSERRTAASANVPDLALRKPSDRRQLVDGFVSGHEAVKAAEICALNIIAQIAAEVEDDISRVEHLVRLGGFVNSRALFDEHAKIINGASDLMVAVFGADVGTHVRAAIGASSLPLNAPVEIDAIVALR